MSRTNRRWWTTGTVFDPASLGNLELRLSGLSLVGATDDPITTWPDTSGHGRDATGSGATRPRISGVNVNNPDSPTNQNGAVFNFGENDNMTGAIVYDGSLGLTVYAWIFQSPFAVTNQVVWGSNHSAPALFYSDFDAPNNIAYEDSTDVHASATAPSSGYHSLALSFLPPPGGAGVAKLYQDGAVILTDVWSIAFAASAYTIGNHNSLAYPFGGAIYELLVFSQGHDAATVAQVLAYGTRVWGI